MSNIYIFTGVVHPKRADVNLPVLKCEFKGMYNEIEGVAESSCLKSIITIKFESKSDSKAFNMLDITLIPVRHESAHLLTAERAVGKVLNPAHFVLSLESSTGNRMTKRRHRILQAVNRKAEVIEPR
jgi:hypothetical protein